MVLIRKSFELTLYAQTGRQTWVFCTGFKLGGNSDRKTRLCFFFETQIDRVSKDLPPKKCLFSEVCSKAILKQENLYRCQDFNLNW